MTKNKTNNLVFNSTYDDCKRVSTRKSKRFLAGLEKFKKNKNIVSEIKKW